MKKTRHLPDYKSMKNTGAAPGDSPPVPWVLEIRLCQDTWRKISELAKLREESYSRIVRYALFRLISRPNLRRRIGEDSNNKRAYANYEMLETRAYKRRENYRIKHRHRLCLYGEDEILVRLTAAQLRCTMTHLVRLALEYRLDEMLWQEMDKWTKKGHQAAAWHYLGQKCYKDVKFHNYIRTHRLFWFVPYKPADYW